MNHPPQRHELLLSLQRALLGEVHPLLRQASIESDPGTNLIRLRSEYEPGSESDIAVECCSRVAAEVFADFEPPWQLDEQHMLASDASLAPLMHIGYKRYEPT